MANTLKEILKGLKVLFVSKKENIVQKEIDILKLFFSEVIMSHKLDHALDIFANKRPDVIISDIELNEGNGIIFCKNIRKTNSSIPIIILSEQKDEKYLFDAIRIQVLDFVVRPLQVEELIFALNQTAKNIVNHGNITIKLANGCIYDYKGKSIIQMDKNKAKLTKNEYRLLELLLANRNKTLTKEEIENYLWANEVITASAFKSLFSRLRNKIGKDTIKNIFGVGYQLA